MFFNINKSKEEDSFHKIDEYSQNSFNNISNALKNNNIKIYIEELFFSFFLSDIAANDKNIKQKERESFMNYFFYQLKSKIRLEQEEITENELDSVFNNRIINYASILEKSNNELSNNFFMEIYEYQIELFSSIILKNHFSKFNPCPKTPLEVTPKTLNTMITTTLRECLVKNHKMTIDFINLLLNKETIIQSNIDYIANFELIKKYERIISTVFENEFGLHNDFINTEIVIILYYFSINTDCLDQNLGKLVDQFNLRFENKTDRSSLISFVNRRIDTLNEIKTNKNIISPNRLLFYALIEKYSHIFSFHYELAESLPIFEEELKNETEAQRERKYEILCRSYTALYKSTNVILDFLSEIYKIDFHADEKEILSKANTTNELLKYKILTETSILTLDEILSLYNFELNEGYHLEDEAYYIFDSFYQKYCHFINLESNTKENKTPRFDYSKQVHNQENKHFFMQYINCKDNTKIFDYLMMQFVLEHYMNMENPNNWIKFITEDNEIKEYMELLKSNPIINDSYSNNTYPNILEYDGFYHIGLFSKAQQGIYFKIYKIKTNFSYQVEYSQLIKKNQSILMF